MLSLTVSSVEKIYIVFMWKLCCIAIKMEVTGWCI